MTNRVFTLASKTDDSGSQLKSRLRADLRAAMKQGSRRETAVLRALIAAIDNAEAVPGRKEQISLDRHGFHSGSAEVERRILDRQQVHNVLAAEIERRERAAAEFDRLGRPDDAEALRLEAGIARLYLDRRM